MSQTYYNQWSQLICEGVRYLESQKPSVVKTYDRFTNVTTIQKMDLWTTSDLKHHLMIYIQLMKKCKQIDKSSNLIELIVNQRLSMAPLTLISFLTELEKDLPEGIYLEYTPDAIFLSKKKVKN